jgi:hypothetical protein
MSELAHELADSLEAESRKTLEFLRGLPSAVWDVQVYADGPAWKVHHLLAHFVEVEGSISRLIRSVADGGPGVGQDFDIDRWNAEHTGVMSEQDRENLMAEFARRRAGTVEMVRGFSDTDLAKRGRHPALGVTEIKHMVRLMYVHLLGHQRDIKRAIKQAGTG